MPVIQAENLNDELLNKINELEKRIERNENKKKINYNKIKYFVINNKNTIFNLLLFILNFFFIYKNLFHNDINIYHAYDKEGIIKLRPIREFGSIHINQEETTLGFCYYFQHGSFNDGAPYFLWKEKK